MADHGAQPAMAMEPADGEEPAIAPLVTAVSGLNHRAWERLVTYAATTADEPTGSAPAYLPFGNVAGDEP